MTPMNNQMVADQIDLRTNLKNIIDLELATELFLIESRLLRLGVFYHQVICNGRKK